MSLSPDWAGRCMFSCGKGANTWMKRFPWPQESREICVCLHYMVVKHNSVTLFTSSASHATGGTLHTSYPPTTPHQPLRMLVYNAWDCRPPWSSSRHWGQGHQVAWVENLPLITQLRLLCHFRFRLWPVHAECDCRDGGKGCLQGTVIQNYNPR